MYDIRRRVLNHDLLTGCFLNLGSPLAAEIVGMAGFDFVVIDLEHGAGFESDLLGQLQALAHTGAAPVIRIESLERQRFHRVLDLGAHGIMVPRVNNAEEARRAVAAMRYPPDGVRGVAMMNRACRFGAAFQEYVRTANQLLACVIQIESPEALSNVESIAAVDGADVLFVGPLDLSHSLGITAQFDHPDFVDAVKRVARAAQSAGKTAGILLPKVDDFGRFYAMGYRFLPCNSDGGLINTAARNLRQSLESAKVAASGVPEIMH